MIMIIMIISTTCGKVSFLIIIMIMIIILILILIIIYRDSNYHAPSPLERVYSIREVATAAGRDNKFYQLTKSYLYDQKQNVHLLFNKKR